MSATTGAATKHFPPRFVIPPLLDYTPRQRPKVVFTSRFSWPGLDDIPAQGDPYPPDQKGHPDVDHA